MNFGYGCMIIIGIVLINISRFIAITPKDLCNFRMFLSLIVGCIGGVLCHIPTFISISNTNLNKVYNKIQ